MNDKYTVKEIPLNLIDSEDTDLRKSLQESFLEVDQKDLIKVRPVGDRFEVINGRHRVKVAKETGKTHILALVENNVDDLEFHTQALILNSGKSNPMGEAHHMAYLISVGGYTGQQIAKMCNYSPAKVSTYLSLIDNLIPEFQKQLQVGKINISTALVLVKLSKEKQIELLGEKKVTYKLAFEALREKQSSQIPLFTIPNDNVKPGLFLTGEQMERLVKGEWVEIDYQGKTLTIQEL